MKVFVVSVSAMLPYPVSEEYRVEASQISTALKRGVDKYRKEKARGKKIDKITAKAVRV